MRSREEKNLEGQAGAFVGNAASQNVQMGTDTAIDSMRELLYKAGKISKQTPEAGEKVSKHTKIEVVVSSGLVGSKKAIPDVSGMSETEAQNELEEAG